MDQPKKKILFALYSLYNGGAEKSLVNLLNELPPDKYDIDIVTFKPGGMFVSQVPSYVNILDVPNDLAKLYGNINEAGSYFLTKLIGTAISKVRYRNSNQKGYRWEHFYSSKIDKLKKTYDIAIAYSVGEILYYIDEKVNAKRKIVWVHNDYISMGYSKMYDHSHMRNMDTIVSISALCVKILQEEFPDLSDKCMYLQNITSSLVVKRRAEEFYPSEYGEQMNILLSVGRLNQQKGFDMAIKAATILKTKGIMFKWFVIGDGQLKDELTRQINESGINDCFVLIGTKQNPYPYIKNCLVFVQPSRFEGKSVVLDEAKILGAPIVATAYPTVKDQIEDGNEGIIVDMSPEAIAEGIERMIENNELREHIHLYLTSREYGNQAEVDKYIELIDQINAKQNIND